MRNILVFTFKFLKCILYLNKYLFVSTRYHAEKAYHNIVIQKRLRLRIDTFSNGIREPTYLETFDLIWKGLDLFELSNTGATQGIFSYTEKTIFPFPFTLNGIWSWWQFSSQFWIIWNSIWFKIEKKTITTIISHSIWMEMEI